VSDYIEITVEKEGVSDTSYEVREVHVLNGKYVKEGEIVLSYETSKALIDVEAPISGYAYHNCEVDDLIEVGGVIIFISQDDEFKIPKKRNIIIKKIENLDKNHVQEISNTKSYTDLAESLITDLINLKDTLPNGQITRKDVVVAVASNLLYLPYDYLTSDHKLVLIGAGGMTSMAIEACNLQGKYNIVGIIDPIMKVGSKFQGVPILGNESHIDKILEMGVTHALITFGAIGRQYLRHEAYERMKVSGFKMANVIHPLANVEDSVTIGDGNLILSQSDVGTNVTIKNNCYINVGSKICHDSKISNNVHLAPGSMVAGRVNIGKNTLFGMGATCTYDCSIGENVIINNNASVTNNVANNVTIFRD
jgi:sugar O-acyltransferase (sialic acid O-acetyltransferase NeuD family)